MKSLFEYLVNLNYKLGNIIFELDESSQELLGSNTQYIVEMGKYYDKINKSHNNGGNRLLWKSIDDDGIRMGQHATDRLDRPIEKGGDGEHIEQREIIDMFIWGWHDLIDMYNNEYLSTYEYDSNVICCRCYIYEDNNKLFVEDKPRPYEKNLWAAFFIKEKPDYKIDVIIKTLYRGMIFEHSKSQERLIITINGRVKQIIPKINKVHTELTNITKYDRDVLSLLCKLITKKILIKANAETINELHGVFTDNELDELKNIENILDDYNMYTVIKKSFVKDEMPIFKKIIKYCYEHNILDDNDKLTNILNKMV